MTSLYKDETAFPKTKARSLHFLISQENKLNGEDFRVLHYFLAKLDAKKPMLIPQTEMAKEMGMQPTHVSRAIRNLKKKGILIAGEKIGRSVEFRFNPDYGKR